MDLHIKWIDRDEPHYKKAITSIEDYLKKGKLPPHWFDYLTRRSGSCIEYAQFAKLYDDIIKNKNYNFTPEDLLLRTRTDILLRSEWNIHAPIIHSSVEMVMHESFPESPFFQNKFLPAVGREGPILPRFRIDDRWVITLRKNLIYLIPILSARVIVGVADHFGDWDSVEDNAYWFNAESQFRGCLRLNNFTVFEFSQKVDECFGNFEISENEFPIYAIRRYQ